MIHCKHTMNKVALISIICIFALASVYIYSVMKTKPQTLKENFETLYVAGVEPHSPWMNVLSNFQTNDNERNNTYLLDFPQQRHNECSYYDGPYAPRTPQDCPNSSFDFVTDMSKYVTGENHAGCMQLGPTSIPYCYSDAKGKYQPWKLRLQAYSP